MKTTPIAPPIDPVPDGADRPLWSVMIPTFNCADYLRQTLASVLSQDPGPDQMQIEVIDDCSTNDDPESVVMQLGKGRVGFYRQPQNGGAINNFNTCIRRSRGRLIHILHGDDFVNPGFYTRIESENRLHPACSAFFVRCFLVNADGSIDSLSPRLKWLEAPSKDVEELLYWNHICTPGAVVRRDFYERNGGFLPHLIHVADWEMWLRTIAEGSALSVNEPLASYRVFEGNDTSRLVKTAENLKDFLRLSEILQARVGTFNLAKFQQVVISTGERQMQLLAREGLREAVEANRAIVDQLRPPMLLRLPHKVWRRLKRVARQLVEAPKY